MRTIILLLILLLPITALAQDNILEVSVNNNQPYIGELITYSVKFTSTLDLVNAQIQLPQFVGFAQQPSQPKLSNETINNVVFNVIQQDILLYANVEGELTINPTTLIVPDTPFQSGTQLDGEITLVNVRPLPSNAPETFTQAVGQFDMRVSLEPPIIQAGEPNLLTIILTGTGNFEQITELPLRLPDNWEIFERPSRLDNSNPRLQSKTFEYQFFTNETGNIAIPVILFTYFDPLTESYKTITEETGSVTVEGDVGSQNLSDNSIQSSNRLDIKLMSTQPTSVMPPISFWILWLIPPAVVFVLMLLRLGNRPTPETTSSTKIKYSKPFTMVTQQLTHAKEQSPKEAHQIVGYTIVQYLSEIYRQDVEISQIPSLVSDLSTPLQQRILTCLEQAQAGQYAPITRADANKLLRRTYKTLQLVEQEQGK